MRGRVWGCGGFARWRVWGGAGWGGVGVQRGRFRGRRGAGGVGAAWRVRGRGQERLVGGMAVRGVPGAL